MKTMGMACVVALCVLTHVRAGQKPEATAKPLETFEAVNVCARVPPTVTIQVTGDEPSWVNTLATLTLSKF
jgi:hypothetical protein